MDSLWRRTSLAGVLLSIGLAGCEPLGPSEEGFLIRVDDILAPQVVAANDTLSVRFHGVVGPNGCYWLSRVEREVNASALEVTFHGAHAVDGDVTCTHAIVVLNHEEIVPPPLVAPFTITVHQPNGSVLERVVDVE